MYQIYNYKIYNFFLSKFTKANLICRRSEADGDAKENGTKNNKSVPLDQLCTWSSHRVMEWLRSIDLSEFVANLRGSGVSGSLIVLHDAFGADLLCLTLGIGPAKTLLRRHISTQFREFIGPKLALRKR